ncbi:MAG: NAD-dependent protein deacylase, partial [Clostridia bacterium]|nr:NAD-dependent protein deacylase [Clostridia bacterium]
ETILSHTFFMKHTNDFYDFYRDKMICLSAKPNPAHIALAKLEKQGKLLAVVTQNIDGLHQAAGSKKVYELHGSVMRNFCMKCGKAYGIEVITENIGVPKCTCGGIIKPDVVLYEEGLNDKTVENAIRAIANADMLIIGGTSLNVYPAAGFLRYFNGNMIALLNKSVTSFDSHADIIIRDPIGEVLSKCV